MRIKEIFSEVLYIEPQTHKDKRGYFKENFNYRDLKEKGIDFNCVQDNLSFSEQAGTIRGLHYQLDPFEQSKIIYVISGKIFDVFLDIRKSSSTYGEYGSMELTKESGFILVPKGFAHGFCTLEDKTLILYKVDNYYNPDYETGVIWNDQQLSIKWPFSQDLCHLSEKDLKLPNFSAN